MAKTIAHGRNGFDAPGTGSETVVGRRRPQPQTHPTTTIIVEQRPLVRELLLRSLKERAGFEVFATGSIDEYIESGNAGGAGLVLISVAGNANGEETRQTLRRAAAAFPNAPIVLLSDGEDLHNILGILQAGTRGYISTAMTLDVAIEALWLVQAGGQFLPASCIMAMGRSGARAATDPLQPRASELFTTRQAAVVRALCQGKANKIIAYELKMKESTVKVHVRNIMKKLKAKNRTEVAYITHQLVGNGQET